MNPDGSALVNLTNTATVSESIPDVSPDGARISFIRIGPDSKPYVWVMNADGSGAVQVTFVPSDGTAWTPDSKIAYRAQTGPTNYEFQTVAIGGNPTVLLSPVTGSHFPPRFNAAGAWLFAAFVPVPAKPSDNTSQIFVVAGGAPTQITFGAVGVNSNQQPSWSPDGTKIVFWRSATSQDLYSVPSAGGGETQLTNTVGVKEGWPSYSPDGTKLIWEQEDATHDFFHKHIVIADANGTNPIPVPTPGLDAAMQPVWAPIKPVDPPPALIAAFTASAPQSVRRKAALPLTLQCIGDTACDVRYRASGKVPRKGKKPLKFVIGEKAVGLSAKTEQTVQLRIPKSAQSALRKALTSGKKPKMTVVASARQPSGPPIRDVRLVVRIIR